MENNEFSDMVVRWGENASAFGVSCERKPVRQTGRRKARRGGRRKKKEGCGHYDDRGVEAGGS